MKDPYPYIIRDTDKYRRKHKSIIKKGEISLKGITELSRQGNSVIFNGDVLNIYIPTKSFERKQAKYNGEYITTMGMFIFEIQTFEQIEKGMSGIFHRLTIPNNIDFQYTDSSKFKGKIDKYPNDEYTVFRLEKGDKFIANVFLQQISSAVITFVKALHGGSMPKSISYDEILGLYHNVLELNNVSLNAPSLIYELSIAEVCRSKKDQSKPFRDAVNKKPDMSRYDYVNINLNKLPMLNSTFSGLTFENMNDAIIKSLDRTETGGEEKFSPLERPIKY